MKLSVYAKAMMSIRMLEALTEWLRNAPITSKGAFSGVEHVDFRPAGREYSEHLQGELDNGMVFVCEYTVTSTLGHIDPSWMCFEGYETGDELGKPSLKLEGTFRFDRLPSGNKKLVFVPNES